MKLCTPTMAKRSQKKPIKNETLRRVGAARFKDRRMTEVPDVMFRRRKIRKHDIISKTYRWYRLTIPAAERTKLIQNDTTATKSIRLKESRKKARRASRTFICWRDAPGISSNVSAVKDRSSEGGASGLHLPSFVVGWRCKAKRLFALLSRAWRTPILRSIVLYSLGFNIKPDTRICITTSTVYTTNIANKA